MVPPWVFFCVTQLHFPLLNDRTRHFEVCFPLKNRKLLHVFTPVKAAFTQTHLSDLRKTDDSPGTSFQKWLKLPRSIARQSMKERCPALSGGFLFMADQGRFLF